MFIYWPDIMKSSQYLLEAYSKMYINKIRHLGFASKQSRGWAVGQVQMKPVWPWINNNSSWIRGTWAITVLFSTWTHCTVLYLCLKINIIQKSKFGGFCFQYGWLVSQRISHNCILPRTHLLKCYWSHKRSANA